MAGISPERIVGVRFTPGGRVYFYDAQGLELQTDDKVVVETEQGLETARVVIGPGQLMHSDLREPLKPVVRQATPQE